MARCPSQIRQLEHFLLLGQAERTKGICRRLAACIADPRGPARVGHCLNNILRARVFAIACGYEDADDLDALCDDPGCRLAMDKRPGAGARLASQPAMSRWEHAPTMLELAKLMAGMIDIYCTSYPGASAAVKQVIDHTCDVVHGYQQLSLRNGHYGERCFLQIHVWTTSAAQEHFGIDDLGRVHPCVRPVRAAPHGCWP